MTPKQKEMQSIILLYEHISQTVYLETKTVTVAARVIHPTEQSVRGWRTKAAKTKLYTACTNTLSELLKFQTTHATLTNIYYTRPRNHKWNDHKLLVTLS